jgi:D-beta-D-heptose 7-phosphate kinase/D-beta-D-heptose 1-phosphate adenosyltransferase
MFGSLLDSFAGLRVVVVGDVMLDEYIIGSVDRISPEAPVMVVRKRSSRWVPGGAANVGKNVVALGGEAVVLGITGEDLGAEMLATGLGELAGLKSDLVGDRGRVTTRKTRVVANHSHQVLRIDEEDTAPITSDVEADLLSAWEGWLEAADVLVFSDYRKGLLTPGLVGGLMQAARKTGVPVLANAKPDSAAIFAGADLVSLNRSEVGGVLGRKPVDRAEATLMGSDLADVTGTRAVLMTLGDLGMVAWSAGESFEIAAPEVEAYDVAGAGDTVLATVAMGWSRRGFNRDVFALAAQTGAKVVQHIGVAVPTAGDLSAIRTLG